MALPATKATTATTTHAVIQAIESYIQNQNLLGEIAELDELLYDVIDLHKDNELALKRVLQCIHNLLQTNNKYNVKFGAKVFHKLIAVVIAGDNNSNGQHVDSNKCSRQLVASVLICVQLYGRKFPRIDGKFLIRQLWSLCLNSERQPHAAQILVHLFDDFVNNLGEECICSSELHLVIKSLLQSETREYRKSAYFLMRKLADIMQHKERETKLLDTLKCSEPQWTAYVTILENLEEQQSHLVLPTLQTLLPRVVAGNRMPDKDHQDGESKDNWISWLRILYVRLLQDNNILVLRWTLTYFLNNFDVTKLRKANLLTEFLAATNRTQLYNVEGYFLPSLEKEKFMASTEDTEMFLEALVTVHWHSAPLVFWLRNVRLVALYILISKNLLLKLSSQVRTLKNRKLRKIAIDLVFEIFKATIESLTLGEYLVFIETLFNISDDYLHMDLVKSKLQNCKIEGKNFVPLNKRCYDIFTNNYRIEDCIWVYFSWIFHDIFYILKQFPTKLHGWWRFHPLLSLIRAEPSNTIERDLSLDFYSTYYNVNTEIFKKSNLCEVQKHMIQQLKCQTKEEKIFVRDHCTDWFYRANLQRWSQIQTHLKPLNLVERGTIFTFRHLAQLLGKSDTRIEDNDNVLKAFKDRLQKHQTCEEAVMGIVNYAKKHLSDIEAEKLCVDLLENRKSSITQIILFAAKTLSISYIVERILDGDTSTGDARIEDAYKESLDTLAHNDLNLRDKFIESIQKQSKKRRNAIRDSLLFINKQLTEKKPRYFENCKEHRRKIRIARALLGMQDHINWSDEMWNSLMVCNDQLNVSYMYECLVARLLPNFDMLLDRMQLMESMKPSQQVSITSVAHLYCIRNWDIIESKHLQKVVTLLLPLTMGANFQTRLLAQLVIHTFAVKCEQTSIDLPVLETLKTAIESTLGSKLHTFENETRLTLSKVMDYTSKMDNHPQANVILYMTNAPFDEYSKFGMNYQLKNHLDEHRNVLITKKKLSTAALELPIEIDNLNVQRKANPMNNIFNTDETIAMDSQHNEQDLIVVASLIDKLPNLGGLARTCEVLGVKTLILSAKSIVDKSDFTNLSMTAEKSLNIMEVKPGALAAFLIEKQSMGYKIVGAEQTAHSVSFTDFKFPEKCVLLLGHEKHGISVDLIALLDFAVEIPQFGMVRSLNVHVTGSLFIWEYCKQHLTKKSNR
ncbi:uncharacterized protein LOC117791092 [Drosophila innubila]|uniref:uncharacterized protein LOC117791092 n=1 Tax=Drosophila innubila TaxID=198719 RepID=UPI00148BF5B0|nr:uncharacterized protein LOC117791092 [Drosophila innubila]